MSLRNRNWRDVVKAMDRFGYKPARQRGSHIILQGMDGGIVSIPRHAPIKETTLKLILERAGISKEDFAEHA